MTSSPSSTPSATCSPSSFAQLIERRLGAGGEALTPEVAGPEAQHARSDLEPTGDVADVPELRERLEHPIGGRARQAGERGDVGGGRDSDVRSSNASRIANARSTDCTVVPMPGSPPVDPSTSRSGR